MAATMACHRQTIAERGAHIRILIAKDEPAERAAITWH